MRLGEQGHVRRAAALLHMLETQLIPKRGLPGAGSPHHQVDRSPYEASAQHGVESRNAGLGALDQPAVSGFRNF